MKNIYPKVEQQMKNDCGPTCLQMVLKYYKGFETLDNIRKLTKPKKEGTSFYQLKEAAKILGLDSSSFCVDDTFLNKKNKTPFIAHLKIGDYYHYIVVYKIDKKLTISDPRKGIIEYITKEEFKKTFTGNILLLYPNKTLSKKKQYKIRDFEKDYIKKEKNILKKLTLLSIVLLILEIFQTTSFYLFLKIKKLHLLLIIFIISFTFLIIKTILEYLENHLTIKLQLKLEEKVKQNIWKDILLSPYTSLISEKKETLILSLRQSEEIVSYFIEKYLFLMLYLPLFLILSIILIIINSSFIYIPLYFILEINLSKYIIKKSEIMKKVYQNTSIEQTNREINISENIEEIRNMNLGDNIYKYIVANLSSFKIKTKEYINNLLIQKSINNILNRLFLLIMSIYLVFLLKENKITIELVLLTYQILQILEENVKHYLTLNINSSRIKILLENHTIYKNKDVKKTNIKNIELRNVKLEEFKYIRNINLKLKEKDKVLLKGKSGIGKTTLMHIIKGDIETKNIKINNILINNDLKQRITYINSNPFLIEKTVLENITFKRNLKEEDINKVLDMTNLKDLKLRSDIENLSSGERQKINLARALLNDTDVFLFDEALNQISEKEEKQIMKKILNNYNDKIIVTVTHRENLNSLFNKKVYFTDQGQLKKGEKNV